jgi:hypothetical protein
MAPNSHFLCNASDLFLDSLQSLLNNCSSIAGRLEQDIVLPVKEDPRLVRRYLYLYTLPMLEAAGLLSNEYSVARFWATVQLCLSLHLRTVDYILDSDRDNEKIVDHTRRAHRYLAHAQDLLQQKGLAWGPSQTALYAQFYEYEVEVHNGFFHDFSSTWRRVSPLCVVPETYLASRLSIAGLTQSYRCFLSWSLLHADCNDVLKDLKSGCVTPVTRLVQEKITGMSHDMAAGADVLNQIKIFLHWHYQSTHSALESYPLWRTVMEQMETIFRSSN